MLASPSTGTPPTDHILLATFSGSFLWQCPHCWHVSRGDLQWWTPWATCKGCRRAVAFGLLGTAEPNESYGAPRPVTYAANKRANRRIPPEGATPLFAQLEGPVRLRCDHCLSTTKAKPELPYQDVTCASCGTILYLNLLIWTSPRKPLRKLLPDDWIHDTTDPRTDPTFHRRISAERRDRSGTRAAECAYPRRVGKPRSGESRESYYARVVAARARGAERGRGAGDSLALHDDRRGELAAGAEGSPSEHASGPLRDVS